MTSSLRFYSSAWFSHKTIALYRNLLRRRNLGLGTPRNPLLFPCTLRLLRYVGPQLTSARCSIERGLIYFLLTLLLNLALPIPPGHSEELHNNQPLNAELTKGEDQYLFAFDFELTLSAPLEEALQRGITLSFIREFELIRPRWYWLDEKILTLNQMAQIDFQNISRQYRVTLDGLGTSSFDNLAEAMHIVSKVSTVVDSKLLRKGLKYETAARIRLDASQLPKPIQVNALLSKDWHWESSWIRWQFQP